jgi:hypothetical protein
MKTHIVIASQLWLLMPAFVDMYSGWTPKDYSDGNPANCFAPFQEYPWLQTVSYHIVGWWNDGVENSFLGMALLFIPCYWLGFFLGPKIFPLLSKLADEPNWRRRLIVASGVLAVYLAMSRVGIFMKAAYNDQCSAYWKDGHYVWEQNLTNLAYWITNLTLSMLYVVFIAAAVPVHLKYLAKVCFSALLCSPFTHNLLDFSPQALELRRHLPAFISPAVEIAWVLTIPFVYELLVGAIFAAILPIIARRVIALYAWIQSRWAR